jgi:outer membrane immunogenic protein
MKKLAICIVAVTGLIATPALAADLAVKAPPPAPAPVYSWNGWYAGLNVGGTWSNSDISVSSSNLQFCSESQGCGGGLETALASAQGATNVFSGKNSGIIAGVQLGYNWQVNSWVAGFEADIQGIGTHNNGRESSNATVGLSGDPSASVTTNLTVTKQIDYFGTVRGRLGWLVNPTLLVYGTGGLAYGGLKSSTSVSQTLNGDFTGVALFPSTNSSISETRAGWTAGGGLEWMFIPQWSVKAEYLYYDLGNVTYSGQLVDAFTTPNQSPAPAFFTNNVQTTTRFNGNIVRLGLNYHF